MTYVGINPKNDRIFVNNEVNDWLLCFVNSEKMIDVGEKLSKKGDDKKNRPPRSRLISKEKG